MTTIPSDPQFYAQLRGTIAKHGPRIAVFEVRVGVREDGSSGTVVHAVTEIAGRTPDEIMTEVKEAIEADAQHWPGMIRYQIAAVTSEGEVVGGRIIVARRGKGRTVDADGNLGGGDEEATPRGHVSQMMKQNADMFRVTLQNNQIMLDLMARALVDTNQRNAQLTERHLQVISLGEDILDRKAERDLRISREKKSDEIKEKALGFLMTFAPVLFGDAMRGTRFEGPAKQLAQGSQVHALMESLKKDPERLGKVLAVFTDEEKGALTQNDPGPILEALSRAKEDPNLMSRFAPLAELLTHDEKVSVAQLAEMYEKDKKQKETPQKAPDIVVTEVASLDEARRKKKPDGAA